MTYNVEIRKEGELVRTCGHRHATLNEAEACKRRQATWRGYALGILWRDAVISEYDGRARVAEFNL
jgi:hypothetical protein